jgi:hypothetical protein
MEIIGYIVPFLIGAFFLWLAYRNFEKGKQAASVVFGVIGALFLVSGLPWFQGVAKTWMVGNINTRMEALKEEVAKAQATAGELRAQLADHQKQIAAHQQELESARIGLEETHGRVADITNQFSRLETMESGLKTAQTNVDLQQRKIQDVEYLVDNLFSKLVIEEIRGSDTDRVVQVSHTNDAYRVAIILQHVPIERSIQLEYVNGLGLPIPQTFTPQKEVYKNIVFMCLHKANPETDLFTVRYYQDTRNPELARLIKASDGAVAVDGMYVDFPPPGCQ